MPAQCPWTCAAPKLLSPWAASLDLDMPPGPLAHQGREKPERARVLHTAGAQHGWSCLGRWGLARQHDAPPRSVMTL
jgi:hypothetical protein